MPMDVMRIGHMRVTVTQGLVPMRVAVRGRRHRLV
jgi:hypothetical protein